MDPIITLPYSEWVIAQQLVKSFPVREGYSVFAPLFRQEKGVDLVLVQRRRGPTRAASIQVKFSRTYDKPPSRGYKFATWFNNFTAPEQADFFALLSLYPTNEGSHRGAASSWWTPLILLFTYKEMCDFLASVKTVRGTRDKMFGFGFSSPERVVQVRGDQQRQARDFTDHILKHRVPMVRDFLDAG